MDGTEEIMTEVQKKERFGFDEYQRQAVATSALQVGIDGRKEIFLNVALGLCGEGGEFADIIKKCVFHNHPLDQATKDKLEKELGDVMWYVALGCEVLGTSIRDICKSNIDKLRERYPEGKFSTERSINRTENQTNYGELDKNALHQAVKKVMEEDSNE